MMKLPVRNTSIFLAILFMIGLAIALTILFQSDAEGIPSRFYLVLTAASLSGCVALVLSLSDRSEIIVYRDQKTITRDASRAQSEENKTTISLDAVATALAASQSEQEIFQRGLQIICTQLAAGQGAVYRVESQNEKRVAILQAGYALALDENNVVQYELGDGLIGQAAATGQTLYLDEVPEGYINIISGLGSASPRFLLIAAGKHQDRVKVVIEIASFNPLSPDQHRFLEEAAQLMTDKLISK